MLSSMIGRALRFVLLVVLAPLWIPLLLVVFLLVLPGICCHHVLKGYWLRYRFRSLLVPQGKRVVLQYSNSPIWQSYVEENWLPRLEKRAVVVNWSDRAMWKRRPPLAAQIAKYWGGDSEYNPLAVVFTGRGKPEIIRFYRALLALKHGKPAELLEAESRLFALLEQGGG